MDWKQYGKRIKIARTKKGLMQKELAERLKCSSAYVSQLESGQRKPSAEMLINIRNVIHVDFF